MRVIRGKIDTIAFGGEGILRHDRLVVFVPFTAPGDEVEVIIEQEKKTFAKGRLLSLLSPGPQRVLPTCPYFGRCGGCQLQHLDPAAQLETKRIFIQEALERIGQLPIHVPPLQPATKQWAYRRHIRLKLHPSEGGFVAGFMGQDNTSFVPLKHCSLFLPPSHPLFTSLPPFLSSLSSNAINEGSLRLVKSDSAERFLLAFQFPCMPSNSDLSQDYLRQHPSWQGIILQTPSRSLQWGDTSCQLHVLGLTARFSPFGFTQAHPEQSALLYQAIIDAVPASSKTVLDLYCGIGITSLLLARQGKCTRGIETHQETIRLAQLNSQLNALPSASFLEGRAEKLGIAQLKTFRPDTVICNPPRTGLAPELLQALAREKPRTLLYISCMPSTLARDLKPLVAAGYTPTHVQGFDLFPQTTHVETLVVLSQ